MSANFTGFTAEDDMFNGFTASTGLNAPKGQGPVITRFQKSPEPDDRALSTPSPVMSIRNPKPTVPPGAMDLPLLRQRGSVNYGQPGRIGSVPPQSQAQPGQLSQAHTFPVGQQSQPQLHRKP